jgi:anti-anti-sigma factor
VAVPSVSVRNFTHTMVVVLRGDIDIQQTVGLRRVLVEAIRRHPRRLIIDLAGVTVLDQTAVGALLVTAETAVDLHTYFAIRHACPAVAEQLRHIGIAPSTNESD